MPRKWFREDFPFTGYIQTSGWGDPAQGDVPDWPLNLPKHSLGWPCVDGEAVPGSRDLLLEIRLFGKDSHGIHEDSFQFTTILTRLNRCEDCAKRLAFQKCQASLKQILFGCQSYSCKKQFLLFSWLVFNLGEDPSSMFQICSLSVWLAAPRAIKEFPVFSLAWGDGVTTASDILKDPSISASLCPVRERDSATASKKSKAEFS